MQTKIFARRGILLIAGLATLVAVVLGILWHNRADHGLTLYGNIDIREVTLGFRVSGRIATLLVDEGDSVHDGQVLARLDTTPLELELNEARANASAIGARMDLLKAGFRTEDVEQARATVAERRAALVDAEQLLARQEQLKGTGAVAQRVYDDAVAARDQARARLKAAEEAFEEFRSGYRRQEIAEGERNHVRALALAAQAEQRLADAVLQAPSDGVVLTRAVESGAILAAGTPVFTLSLIKPVWARIYIGEADLGRAVPGRAVLIYTDGRPDHPYHGQIGYVSPVSEFTPKNVETPDLRTALVYRARVVVSDPDEGLRQGMPVTVKLSAQQQ
jgi:HlyD family secretion protein